MKILLVTTSYPQGQAGAEAAGTFVVDFAHELRNHAEVAVVAPGMKEETQTDEQGLVIYRYKAPRQPLSTLKPANPFHWQAILSTLASGKRITLKAARTMEADHILALWILPSGYWAQHAAKVLGIPYATWALGSDIWSLSKIPLVKAVLSDVLGKAAFRFADGYQLAEDVESFCGKPCRFLASARKLPVCGLPLEHKPPYRLVFLGRWHPNKGIDLLLDALISLSDDDWERIACVRIAGGGPLETLVKQKISTLLEQARPIELEGYKDLEEAAELLIWSDVILIPSRIESVPVIYSDGLQVCRLLLATPVGDFPVLAKAEMQGGNLLLSSDVSVESLALAIKQLLWNPAEYRSYGVAEPPVSFAAHNFFDLVAIEKRF